MSSKIQSVSRATELLVVKSVRNEVAALGFISSFTVGYVLVSELPIGYRIGQYVPIGTLRIEAFKPACLPGKKPLADRYNSALRYGSLPVDAEISSVESLCLSR